MKTLIRNALIGALMTSAAGAAVQAQQVTVPVVATRQPSTFHLSAYGEVRVQPDMATINMGVMTEAPTAAEAMRRNAEQMTRVMDALRRQGIAQADIQTSSLNLNPQYTYRENEPPVLRGYQAQNQVAVRVMDLARLGAAIDAVVAAGSNQINGISFGLADPQMAENAARRQAYQALQQKAQLYAGVSQLRILRLINLTEGGGYTPQPPVPMPMYARAEMAQANTPVAGGELAVRIDISGLYEVQ